MIRANEENIAWSNVNDTFTSIYTALEILVSSTRKHRKKTLLKDKQEQTNTFDFKAQTELVDVQKQLNTLYKLQKVMNVFSQHYVRISSDFMAQSLNHMATTPRYIPAQLANVNTDTLQSELSKLSLKNRVAVTPDKENIDQPSLLPTKRKITFATPEQQINRNIPKISPLQNFDDDDMLISNQPDSPQSPCKKLKYYEFNLFNDLSPRQDSDSNIIESDAQFDL